MSLRIAINGLGRIGRAFLRHTFTEKPDGVEIVAVNDLGDAENFAYLLRRDTVYGPAPFPVSWKEGALIVDGHEVKFISEKDPTKLPWKDLRIDIVVESTGIFESYEKAKMHLDAGAKRVVISAPAKGEPPPGVSGAMILVGINEEKLKTCDISSNASCTTNAASPLIAILDEKLGIDKALLNTVHGYTGTQALVDGPAKKDFLRGRAAAQNIIPSSTGAASAIGKVITSLNGKFDGVALRVPVPVGSVADITFIAKRETTVEEVNDILRKAALEPRWKGIFRVSEEPLASSDIIGDTHASIADLSFTRVIGNLVKVFGWYDNETGYSQTLLRHVIETGKHIR